MGLHSADRMCVRCGNLMRQPCYCCRNDMHRPTLGPNLETLYHKNKCESDNLLQAYSAYSVRFDKLHASNARQ